LGFQRFIPPLCALTVVLTFVTLTRADPDLWGHVRFGADMIDSGTIRVPDAYSFTSDRPWINHEWLAEIVMASAYRAAGATGLVLLKLAIVLLSLACIWRIARDEGAGVHSAAVMTALALCGILPRVQQIRPQLFSVLCFSVLVLLLRRAETRPSRLWLVPPLMIFWANTHGGWLVGCGTLGLWCAAKTWTLVRTPRDRQASLRPIAILWGACAASIAATLLNPYGFGLWRFLSETVGLSRRFIPEWGMATGSVTTLSVWALMMLIAIAGIRRAALSERLPSVLVTVFWGLAAFKVSRLDSFLALSAVGLMAPELVRMLEERRQRASAGPVRKRLVAQVAIALVALVALAVTLPLLRNNLLCIDVHASSTMPEPEAMEFVRRAQARGRMVTFFDWGQYAIWHKPDDLRVSMDGRRETVYSDRNVDLHLDMYLALRDGLEYLNSLDADYVWIPKDVPLATTLAASPDWAATYQSGRSVIFARRALVPTGTPTYEGSTPQCRCFPGP
jgi:hypothetical protein